MAIDSYSLCPGGRGKKIQFCCPEHIKDLEQIDKMLEGEQYAAGLAFVENLQKTSPDCACLIEAKCLFQRMIGLWEAAYETAREFVEREPQNVVALTESATTAALLNKPQEATSQLVAALENVEGDQFPLALVQAMLTAGLSFYENGRLFQAVAIAKQLQAFAPQDKTLNGFLYKCLGDETVPLMVKEQILDLNAPENFPKRDEYNRAVSFLSLGQWRRGREILESLLPLAGQWPNIYRNLGIVELWFANDDKGRAYLEDFLKSDGVDYESKVDVEQLLILLRRPTWDDVENLERRVYSVEDFDAVLEKMLSSRSLLASQRARSPRADGVHPKAAFAILNRPLNDKTIDLTLDDVSSQVGYLFAYGRQTTRSARLEIYAVPDDFSIIESTLNNVLGCLPPVESQEELQGQPVAWTMDASTPKFLFRDPSKITKETLEKLYDDFLISFSKKWFEHSYGCLGGVSPRDAIKTTSGKCVVDALIRIVVGVFAPPYSDRVDELLRSLTAVSKPDAIVPPENFSSNSEAAEYFRRVPLWRWGRLQLERCNVETLVQLLQIANLVAPRDIREKIAKELISRPQADVQYEDRAVAYSILVDAAILNRDSDKALEMIAEAGRYARSIGQSDGQWMVLEIMTRFRRQEFDKVRELSRQVFANYQDDKQTIQTLRQFFDELNASVQASARTTEAYQLQSNQTRTASARGISPRRDEETRLDFSVGTAARADVESAGLWVPNGDAGNGTRSGGAKLWVPD